MRRSSTGSGPTRSAASRRRPASIALATTPIAFVLLGRREYLHTRRGRTYRKPEWWSVVCGMALVMGVPGIILALLVKSQYFDEDRYAFDPNDDLVGRRAGPAIPQRRELERRGRGGNTAGSKTSARPWSTGSRSSTRR